MDKDKIEARAAEWSDVLLGLLKKSTSPTASVIHLIELRARLYNAIAVYLEENADPAELIKRLNNVVERWEGPAQVSCPRVEGFDLKTGIATLARTSTS
jgi:predicted SpoU family rRNA methylase